jgi:hypothetical protein
MVAETPGNRRVKPPRPDSTGRLVAQLEDLSASCFLGSGTVEDEVTENLAAALALASVAFTHDCTSNQAGGTCADPGHKADRDRLTGVMETVGATPVIDATGLSREARRTLLQVVSVPPGTPLTAGNLAGWSPGAHAVARAGLAELEASGWIRRTGPSTWVRPEAKPRQGER